MAQRKKRRKEPDLLTMGLVGVVVYVVLGHYLSLVSWTFIGAGVFMFWISFVMPTRCDYETLQGRACVRGVRGKLRGCRDHGRLKRDAMFAVLKLRNPGQIVRVMWLNPGSVVQVQGQNPVSKQSANETAILLLTGLAILLALMISVFAWFW